jgi:glycine/D-amino acid oxidase-like deaminating enzyme
MSQLTPQYNFDYVIVGQGICGTLLSYFLKLEEKKVLVIDEPKPYTASKVASGVINPITGRRLVRTWMIEEIMPFSVDVYKQIEIELQSEFITQNNILDFHPTEQMQVAFDERLQQESAYLKQVNDRIQWQQYFNFPFGIGEINPSWLININQLLEKWRSLLQQENVLLENKVDVNQLIELYPNSTIIFCDGTKGFDNPYFNKLPYAKNKGEALIVSIPGLPRNNIYKSGISLVPWKDDLWWVGSSYEWNFDDELPTENFRIKMEAQLKHFLKIPFQIIDHIASVRPANIERRPFVGLHPLHSNIGILNGMGTKGCSLAPYFANQLAQYLVHQSPIDPLADVIRFRKILST